jgi:secreted trypsin-like serine protease
MIIAIDSSSFLPSHPCLAARTEPRTGRTVHVAGWGSTISGAYVPSNPLLEAQVSIVARTTCRRQNRPYAVTANMICASAPGRDTCQGDSGGPLVELGAAGNGADILWGLTSWGIGCADGFPGVYTNVRRYTSWIQSYLNLWRTEPLPSDPCACTQDGISGGVNTGRIGCDQHSFDVSDTDFYCMTVGGASCGAATPSDAFPGASWKLCTVD